MGDSSCPLPNKYDELRAQMREEAAKAEAARKPYSRGLHPRVITLKAHQE